MDYLINHSKLNEAIAIKEIESLFSCVNHISSGFSITNTNNTKDFDRLAYSKKVNEIIYTSNNIDQIKKKISEENLVSKIYKENFAFRKKNFDNDEINEIQFAEFLGHNIQKNINEDLNINLKNPSSLFELFKINNKYYFTINRWKNNDDFSKRTPHKREKFYPISLKPKLAKALVNIGSTKNKYLLIDPFCGTGGILIESSIMNIDFIGNDLDRKMIDASKENLKQYSKNIIKIYQKDAKVFINELSKIINKDYCIVTDPPYAKNTKNIIDFYKFYEDLFRALNNSSAIKIVIMLPIIKRKEFIFDHNKLLSLVTKYKITKIDTIYVHKSLSRIVYLFD